MAVGQRKSCSYATGVALSNSRSLFHFYIPEACYLDESPIQFGQISTMQSSSGIPSQETLPIPSSLPESLPFTSSQVVPLPFPMAHGTTTLAFMFQGGVLAAADTRSSCSGLVAELRLYQLRYGRRLSTRGAAKLLSHMLHPFKGTELCVAATLCGWDGGDLFYVCSDGTRLEGSLFSVGSGSPYAYSILDQGVWWGLTVEEATSIAREAVYRATHRDAYSGNFVDVYHVTSKGWTRRTREDLKEEREANKRKHQ
uniref:Uncharacterized protein n=1 Tax=Xiphophorus couchianus TaxID=32473 RepID=A0A3B5LU13_9TELE